MKITVMTCISPDNFEYFPVLRNNLISMASPDVTFEFRVALGQAYVTHSRTFQRSHLQFLLDHDVIAYDGLNLGIGSTGHANCLMKLLKTAQFPKDDYTLITDLDVMIVQKDYDITIKDLCETQGYDIIGHSNYHFPHDLAANSATPGFRYLKKPNVVWSMFKNASAPWNELDLSPNKIKSPRLMTDDEAQLYNLPKGSYLHRDSGWLIPTFIKDNGLKYLGFDVIKSPNPSMLTVDPKSFEIEEGYLNGKIFLAHQGGSARIPYRSNDRSTIFYDGVSRYISSLECQTSADHTAEIQSDLNPTV